VAKLPILAISALLAVTPSQGATQVFDSVPALQRTAAELHAELREKEAELEAATVRGDQRALERLYAPDFQWRHWDGTVDTKASWLRFLKDSVRYRRRAASPERIELYATAAVVSGRLESRGRYIGESKEFAYDLSYTRVWIHDGRVWSVLVQLSRQDKPTR
jgi:Domain of unknown function (DUF4440)